MDSNPILYTSSSVFLYTKALVWSLSCFFTTESRPMANSFFYPARRWVYIYTITLWFKKRDVVRGPRGVSR